MEPVKDLEVLLKTLNKMDLPGEALQFIGGSLEELEIREIGSGGAVNYISRIATKDGSHSVAVKLADVVPHEEALAEVRLPLERQEVEYEALTVFHKLLPGCVPQPYYFNKDLHIIIMEDLSHMELLSARLRNGDISRDTAVRLGSSISTLQHRTHRQLTNPHTWQQYKQKLSYTPMKEVLFNVRTVFSLGNGESIHKDKETAKQFMELKEEIANNDIFNKMRTIFFREDCLGHLDYHTNSVFVNDDRIAMFDLECGAMCNQALPLGILLAFYLLGMLESEHKYTEKREEIRAATKEAMSALIDSFLQGFGDDVHVLETQTVFYPELAAFIGLLLFSFTSSCYMDSFLILSDEDRFKALRLSVTFMKTPAHYTSVEQIIETAFSTV